VSFDADGRVRQIQVKAADAKSHWIWGAFSAAGATLRELQEIWNQPGRGDEYLGTLVNEYLARGGIAWASPVGRAYVDVGTLHGYREATRLLEAFKLLGDASLVEPVSARTGAPEPGMATHVAFNEVRSCSKL